MPSTRELGRIALTGPLTFPVSAQHRAVLCRKLRDGIGDQAPDRRT